MFILFITIMIEILYFWFVYIYIIFCIFIFSDSYFFFLDTFYLDILYLDSFMRYRKLVPIWDRRLVAWGSQVLDNAIPGIIVLTSMMYMECRPLFTRYIILLSSLLMHTYFYINRGFAIIIDKNGDNFSSIDFTSYILINLSAEFLNIILKVFLFVFITTVCM